MRDTAKAAPARLAAAILTRPRARLGVSLASDPAKYVLPDVVVALKGPPSLPVEIELDGHVDSVQRRLPNGEAVSLLRTTFETVPDAPVSKFTVELQGGSKGLFTNSANLCQGIHRATAKFAAQNGRGATLHPAVKASCK